MDRLAAERASQPDGRVRGDTAGFLIPAEKDARYDDRTSSESETGCQPVGLEPQASCLSHGSAKAYAPKIHPRSQDSRPMISRRFGSAGKSARSRCMRRYHLPSHPSSRVIPARSPQKHFPSRHSNLFLTNANWSVIRNRSFAWK
jgi:hypothetical protein